MNWKHGRRAETAGIVAHFVSQAYRENPELEERTRAVAAAIAGDHSAMDPVIVRGLVETSLTRDMVVKAIADRGVLLEQPVAITPAGEVIRKTEANPALSHLHKLDATLGFTAKDTLLSRKSRGEDAKNAELEALLRERRVRIVNYTMDPANKEKLAALLPRALPSPRVIDVTLTDPEKKPS